MYKIRWKNYKPVDDTWESFESLSCPDILEAYNLKHKINIPKSSARTAKRSKNAGKKSVTKKHRNSIDETDEDDDEIGYADASDDDNKEYEVDKIVQMRFKKDGSREFLVHWKRWSRQYDSWEPESNLSCPEMIEKFLKNLDELKSLNQKELRVNRKHTQRFTLNAHDTGRRLSKRNNRKERVTYYGEDMSDED